MINDYLYSKFEDGIIIQGYFGSAAEMPLEINGKKVVAVGQIYYNDKSDVLNSQMVRNASAGTGKRFSYSNVKKAVIGGNIEVIKCYAFYGSRNLESVEIGENVKTIENGVFLECSKLKYVALNANAFVNEISAEMFKKCVSLRNIKLPENITKIGVSAFEQCVNLTVINLNNINKIGRRCFYGCSSLTEVKLKKLHEISSFAFAQCSMLTDFQIEGCEIIGDCVLKDCKKLYNVRIRNNSVDICKLLEDVAVKIKLIIDYGSLSAEIILLLNLKDYSKCFNEKEIDFGVYDEISSFSVEIAFERLENPFRLGEGSKIAYLCTLKENLAEALNIAAEENSIAKLKILCENNVINEKNMKKAVDILQNNKELRAYLIEFLSCLSIENKKYIL